MPYCLNIVNSSTAVFVHGVKEEAGPDDLDLQLNLITRVFTSYF